MKKKIIIIISIVLIVATIILIVVTRNKNSYSESLDNPSITYVDKDIAEEGDPVQYDKNWSTECTVGVGNETRLYNTLKDEIKGVTSFAGQLRLDYNYSDYEPIYDVAGYNEIFYEIYTKEDTYIAVVYSDYTYWYNIKDNIVHSKETVY